MKIENSEYTDLEILPRLKEFQITIIQGAKSKSNMSHAVEMAKKVDAEHVNHVVFKVANAEDNIDTAIVTELFGSHFEKTRKSKTIVYDT